MKKRLLSVLLACVLAFGFVSPTLAVDVTTPATDVRFFSLVGQGGTLNIETAIVVKDAYYGGLIPEYPSLYILKDGTLTLLRTFKVGECNCSRISHNGNARPVYAFIDLLFTNVEYLAFDFTADYVLKIPTGIYKDESGNPIGQQSVSFNSSDIKNERNEFTRFGRIFESYRNYLHSFQGNPILNWFLAAFDNVTNYIFGMLNIKIIKPVTVA